MPRHPVIHATSVAPTRVVIEAAILAHMGHERLAEKHLGPQAAQQARDLRATSLVDLCRAALLVDGHDAPSGREALIRAALSTYSLPVALLSPFVVRYVRYWSRCRAVAWVRAVDGKLYLSDDHTLRAVDLAARVFTDDELAHLKGLTQFQTLNLSHTQVTDAGLVHLEGLTQLQTLRLWSTRVTDAGLVHLKGLIQLQTLDLHFTRVTDAGLEHIKGLNQLQKLTLPQKVTNAGIRRLRKTLPKCDILTL